METSLKIIRAWPIIAITVFYLYLIFHAFNGSQGVLRWVDYQNDTVRLQAELKSKRELRQSLEAKADLLRASHLNLEALDEGARKLAFVSHPNELTIWLDQTP